MYVKMLTACCSSGFRLAATRKVAITTVPPKNLFLRSSSVGNIRMICIVASRGSVNPTQSESTHRNLSSSSLSSWPSSSFSLVLPSSSLFLSSSSSSSSSFSSSSSTNNNHEQKPEDTDKNSNSSSRFGQFGTRILGGIMTPQNQAYAALAGGTVGAYGISKLFLGFTNFFTHLTPTVIATYGFYTGFGCATLVGGFALVAMDNIYIRADPVYHYCIRWVQNDPRVQQVLGDGIQPGQLRSYRLDAGKVEVTAGKLVWRPPRIQMLFDITGTGPPYRTGLVTCEAIKAGGLPPKLKTTILKVDYETGNEGQPGGTTEGDETLFLVGTMEDIHRISKCSGFSLAMLASQVHINKAAAECKQANQ